MSKQFDQNFQKDTKSNKTLRVFIVITFGVFLAIQYSNAPHSSEFMGPLFLIHYDEGFVGYLITIPNLLGLLAFLILPSKVTLFISGISFGAWLFFGILGKSIGV